MVDASSRLTLKESDVHIALVMADSICASEQRSARPQEMNSLHFLMKHDRYGTRACQHLAVLLTTLMKRTCGVTCGSLKAARLKKRMRSVIQPAMYLKEICCWPRQT